ncbi:MAG TPA: prepilin-type N-terminal cleavage/methylation domain-containing protein [Oscillatoriaceae cyanobacterium]
MLASRLKLANQLSRLLAKRARKGFTLIELLVVVVIIGILASIALPSFLGAQDKARNASVQGGMNTVKMALEQYGTDNNGSYPTSLDSTGGILTNNYLPGNNLPRSPWANSVIQANNIVPTGCEVTASAVNGGSSMPEVGMNSTVATTGSVPTSTTFTAADYGAFEYDYDTGSQVYVLYGTGKTGKVATLASKASNGGQ